LQLKGSLDRQAPNDHSRFRFILNVSVFNAYDLKEVPGEGEEVPDLDPAPLPLPIAQTHIISRHMTRLAVTAHSAPTAHDIGVEGIPYRAHGEGAATHINQQY
jgi:hypothetical protein